MRKVAVTRKYSSQIVIVCEDALKQHVVERSEREHVGQAEISREYMWAGVKLQEHVERTGYPMDQLLGVLDKVRPIGEGVPEIG